MAQDSRWSYGLKGGITTTDLTYRTQDESRRYVLGASVEYRLWGGFAAESGLLYRRTGTRFARNFDVTGDDPTGSSRLRSIVIRMRANVFEIPVLGKYYFRRDSNLQPFVLTGYTFRKPRAQEESASLSVINGAVQSFNSKGQYWTPLEIGAAFGTGLRWRVSDRFSVVPEFRYTRYSERFNAPVSRDQADFLLGIRF